MTLSAMSIGNLLIPPLVIVARSYTAAITDGVIVSSLISNLESLAFLRYPFLLDNMPLSGSLNKKDSSSMSHFGCIVFHKSLEYWLTVARLRLYACSKSPIVWSMASVICKLAISNNEHTSMVCIFIGSVLR